MAELRETLTESLSAAVLKPLPQSGDAVLDVKDIARYGRTLGPHVTEFEVKEGLHDLVLSKPAARASVYAEIFRWLRSNGLER